MMKKMFSVAIMAAAVAAPTAFAENNAAGGIINFTGAITDTTCTINGGKSADFTVALSPISVTDAGNAVGPITKNKKSFSLTFSGCSPAAGTRTSEHRSMYSYVRLSIDRCTATYV